MRSLDIPEVLILVSIIGILAWAVYNRLHPGAGESK
jgi:hypothetical protein